LSVDRSLVPHLFSSTATQHLLLPVRSLWSRWSTPVGSSAVLAARFVALVAVAFA
jgi:hypothetical protein